MGDSWEDWEDDVPLPVVNGVAAPAADPKKFADEDEEVEEPKWKGTIPEPQQSKPKVSRYDENRGMKSIDEGPLDDPVAERLRQQRLVEEADYESTMELFGKTLDLDGFLPKSAKDFEEMAQAIAAKYFLPNSKGNSAQYKAGVKVLLHHVLRPMSATDVKDVETAVAGIRADKLKEEKLAAGGKKTMKKMALNVGRSGGTAGLDDYKYDDPLDDDFDFM